MSEVKKTLTGDRFTVSHSVGQKQAGIRLDSFLKERYKHRSRESLKRAIENRSIQVVRNQNSYQTLGQLKPSFALQTGDLVLVISTRKPEPEANFDYKILFEDESIIVINKPSNLLVHPVGKFFFNTLLTHLRTDGFTKELQAERQFYLVHRIDRETSGILLMAKSREACAHLHKQFFDRETKKYYLAIVHGKVQEKRFTVNQALGKKADSRIALKIHPVDEAQGGLPSLTEFENIESRGNYSLIACFPRTGRQHQIRVHAHLSGHPLVGDKIYGLSDSEVSSILDVKNEVGRSSVSPNPMEDHEDLDSLSEGAEPADEEFEVPGPTSRIPAEIQEKLILPRHALHAAGLRFRHPRTNEWMSFESDLPEDLREWYEKLTGQPIPKFRTQGW